MNEFEFLMRASQIAQDELIVAQEELRGAKLSIELCEAEVYNAHSGALPGKDVSARKAFLFLECYDFHMFLTKAETNLDIAKAHMHNTELTLKHYFINLRGSFNDQS